MTKKEFLKVREYLKSLGWVDSETNYDNATYLKNATFYLRHYIGEAIELGVRKTFDRWANSIDFFFNVPKTEKGWTERLEKAEALVKAGEYHKPWGKRVQL